MTRDTVWQDDPPFAVGAGAEQDAKSCDGGSIPPARSPQIAPATDEHKITNVMRGVDLDPPRKQVEPATDEEIASLGECLLVGQSHIKRLIARIKAEREQTIRECQAAFKKMPDGTKIDDAFEALLSKVTS